MEQVLELMQKILEQSGTFYLQDKKNTTPTWVALLHADEITCEEEVITSLESACDTAGLRCNVDRDRHKAVTAIFIRKPESPSLETLRSMA